MYKITKMINDKNKYIEINLIDVIEIARVVSLMLILSERKIDRVSVTERWLIDLGLTSVWGRGMEANKMCVYFLTILSLLPILMI